MNRPDWSMSRKRKRCLSTVSSGKFVMSVIDSLLIGEVIEPIRSIRDIECRTQRHEGLVYAYARRIWEEPDATTWVSQRIVRLYE